MLFEKGCGVQTIGETAPERADTSGDQIGAGRLLCREHLEDSHVLT